MHSIIYRTIQKAQTEAQQQSNPGDIVSIKQQSTHDGVLSEVIEWLEENTTFKRGAYHWQDDNGEHHVRITPLDDCEFILAYTGKIIVIAPETIGEMTYADMQEYLDEMDIVEYEEDAIARIWLGSLEAYNDGYLIGAWISLPCDEDELQNAMDIVTRNGRQEFYLGDFESEYLDIGEYSNPLALNEQAEALDEYSDDEMRVLRWLQTDQDCDFKTAQEQLDEVSVYHDEDDLINEWIENYILGGMKESEVNRLWSYINRGYVLNEIEHSCAVHREKDNHYNEYIFVMQW